LVFRLRLAALIDELRAEFARLPALLRLLDHLAQNHPQRSMDRRDQRNWMRPPPSSNNPNPRQGRYHRKHPRYLMAQK